MAPHPPELIPVHGVFGAIIGVFLLVYVTATVITLIGRAFAPRRRYHRKR